MTKKKPINEETQLELVLERTNKGNGFRERVVAIKQGTAGQARIKMLSTNIKAARIYANMSQSQLGRLLYGYDGKNRICEFETGKAIPNVFDLQDIAKHTGVSLDFINGISPDPLLDEYGTRVGLARCTLQDAIKPHTDMLAKLLAVSIAKIPTSPTLALIEKAKKLDHYLKNVRQYTDFEHKIAGSGNLIKAIGECVDLARIMEREAMINMKHTERAALDMKIHDEKGTTGHLFRWEAEEVAIRVIGEDERG